MNMKIPLLTLSLAVIGASLFMISQAKATAWTYCRTEEQGCIKYWGQVGPYIGLGPGNYNCLEFGPVPIPFYIRKECSFPVPTGTIIINSRVGSRSECNYINPVNQDPSTTGLNKVFAYDGTGDPYWYSAANGSHWEHVRTSATAKKVPSLDYLCKLPVAAAMGVHYTDRCTNADISNCKPDAGGRPSESFGENDVPINAWYSSPKNLVFPQEVRCQCGCFTGETLIKTSEGYESIDVASANAYASPVKLALPMMSGSKQQRFTSKLVTSDFTKGAEEKPVLRVILSNEDFIDLTDAHPVLIKENNSLKMVQASKLTVGSTLLSEYGEELKVKSIEARILKGDNSVYNVDTKEATADGHIISANGLRMGDVIWQRKLSERESRISNVLLEKKGDKR
ncbi:MAG: hypothetical protein HQK51_10170 [Oligoflexia bacterium]|nr:hypothetical protein [Oligoflexia bacterium]